MARVPANADKRRTKGHSRSELRQTRQGDKAGVLRAILGKRSVSRDLHTDAQQRRIMPLQKIAEGGPIAVRRGVYQKFISCRVSHAQPHGADAAASQSLLLREDYHAC